MTGAVRVVAGWLTPVMWLTPAALVLRDGPDGLWVGFVVALAPLVALLVGAARAPGLPPVEPPVSRAALVAVVGLLVCANLALAGDVAAGLGVPRWHGVVLAGGPVVLVLLWRRVAAAPAALLVVALAILALPLLALAQVSGMAPAQAWQALAGQADFRFMPGSAAVTDGRDLAAGSRRAVVALDEEQRVSAPIGGAVRMETRDALREPPQELKLAPGQALALRAGDRVEPEPGTRLRFEAGRRVPGAPPSGAAWAAGGPPARPLALLSLGVTLVGGAVALFAEPRFVAPRRRTVGAAGAGLLAALLWAQGWAVYGALQAPDVFLGGVTLARVVEIPGLASARLGPLGPRLQSTLLFGLLAALAAASTVLIARPAAGDAATGEKSGGALGLWALVFAGAGAGALWTADPWTIALWALGLGASAIAPGALLPAATAHTAAAVSGLGLAVFVALSALAWLGVAPAGVPAALTAHPVLAAVVAAVALRCVLGRMPPR